MDVFWGNNENSDVNDKLYVVREKLKEYVEKKKKWCLDDDISDGVNVIVKGVRARGQTFKANFDIDKVAAGYESGYLDFSNPGSYKDTDGFEEDNV